MREKLASGGALGWEYAKAAWKYASSEKSFFRHPFFTIPVSAYLGSRFDKELNLERVNREKDISVGLERKLDQSEEIVKAQREKIQSLLREKQSQDREQLKCRTYWADALNAQRRSGHFHGQHPTTLEHPQDVNSIVNPVKEEGASHVRP